MVRLRFMLSGHRTPALLAAALILVFTIQSFLASRQKSPTSDEPAHIAAGLSYLQTGIFHINIQHPPLVKELSAASLLLAGVRYPRTAEAMEVVEAPPNALGREWKVGYGIIGQNGPDRVMFWARLPMIVIAALLGVALFLLGRQVIGDGAALGAVFLYALDPTLLAHSYLVTTDVGVTAFTMLFLFTLWRYIQQPGRGRMIWCGVAMGAMLGAKYSAVFLLPVAAILLAASTVRFIAVAAPAHARKGKHGRPAEALRKATIDREALLRAGIAFAWMCGIAWVIVWGLFFFHGGPFIYLEGMERVNADHNPNFLAYLAGDLQPSFSTYFAACYLLKEPLAAILLAIGGLWLLARSRKISGIAKLFVLLPPAVLFAAYTWRADDLGIRYLIPVLPFAWLLGGLALAAMVRSGTLGMRIAGIALCAWIIVAAVGIYPDHLSYFNESACLLQDPSQIGWDGGSRCGTAWLGDSNVDWGQGLKQLKSWLDAHAANRPVYLACFTCTPPEYYGIHASEPDLVHPPKPGLYVISGHFVGSVPALGRRMRTTLGYWIPQVKPTAIVGHAYYVYDLSGGGPPGSQP